MHPVRPTGSGVYMQQAKPAQPAQVAPNSQFDQIEPIKKVQTLLPQLKEALVKMMQVSSQNVALSISIDDMIQKGVDGSTIPSFSKCLEQFYSLCDQLECQLNLAYQQLSQSLLSAQHVPALASLNVKTDPKGSQAYSSYIGTVEHQLRTAKEVHELLSNCAKNLSEHKTNHPT